MTVVAVNDVYREMAQLATSFGWGRDEVMGLEHAERRRWVREATTIAAGTRAGDVQRGMWAGPRWGADK